MPETTEVARIKCNTVGDLLDELAKLANDSALWDVMDSEIESTGGDSFSGFTITRRKLSDKSEVLDFALFE